MSSGLMTHSFHDLAALSLRDWKVSELESVRIRKCQNWKVSESESVRIGKCQIFLEFKDSLQISQIMFKKELRYMTCAKKMHHNGYISIICHIFKESENSDTFQFLPKWAKNGF